MARPEVGTPEAAILYCRDLEVELGGRRILSGVGLALGPGESLGVLGPNGAGKTTLLRCLSRWLRPSRGEIFLEGEPLERLSAREVARKVAVLPQSPIPEFEFTAAELVAMGRHPHLSRLAGLEAKDLEAIEEALALTGTTHLAERPISTLSAGEQQRVALARALAQEPRVLLLDEPTAHLDVAHQVETLELLSRLARERKVAVVAAVHDLNLAAEFFPRLLLLNAGRVMAAGPPEEVLRPSLLSKAFGAEVVVARHPGLGSLVVLPRRRGHAGGEDWRFRAGREESLEALEPLS